MASLPYLFLVKSLSKIGNAHTCIDDREITTVCNDGIEIKFTKPSGGAEPLRHIGDQVRKPSRIDCRLASESAENFLSFELTEHRQRVFGCDRRQAQGRVLQCFDPHTAKAGYHDGPEVCVAPGANGEFETRPSDAAGSNCCWKKYRGDFEKRKMYSCAFLVLIGLSHGIIDKSQYSALVAAVIGSAVIPTVIANAFYLPRHMLPKTEMEDIAGQQQAPATRLPQLVRRAEMVLEAGHVRQNPACQ